jgi:hypothetical protein
MNRTQNARYKAYSLALAHLKENEVITKTMPVFEPVYLSAKALLDEIGQTNERKVSKLKGLTESKYQYQEVLAAQALATASVISSYATKINDPGLKEAMNFSQSELLYGPEMELGTKCSIILSKARELAAQLQDYGINQAYLDGFAKMAGSYKSSVHKPRNAFAERKQAGMLLNEQLRKLLLIFTGQLDPLLLMFKTTHQDFYDQYLIKRMVVDAITRKTRLVGLVTEKATGQALANVAVTVKGAEDAMVVTTAEDGSYSLKTPLLKQVPVLYQKMGYKPLAMQASLKRGKATTVNVELESV